MSIIYIFFPVDIHLLPRFLLLLLARVYSVVERERERGGGRSREGERERGGVVLTTGYLAACWW